MLKFISNIKLRVLYISLYILLLFFNKISGITHPYSEASPKSANDCFQNGFLQPPTPATGWKTKSPAPKLTPLVELLLSCAGRDFENKLKCFETTTEPVLWETWEINLHVAYLQLCLLISAFIIKITNIIFKKSTMKPNSSHFISLL